ncbi:MAG TPA: transposase [Gammaproteobacteria bacterium]
MPNYRRVKTAGATYFFTVVAHARQPIFAEPGNVALLRRILREVRDIKPYTTDAIVILPDHLHAIWTLPEGDAAFSARLGMIKGRFTKALREQTGLMSMTCWQKRFWEHLIRNETDFANHLDYIHYNPVKHGLCATPVAWPHSSFNRWVDRGAYSRDWGSSFVGRALPANHHDLQEGGNFGE